MLTSIRTTSGSSFRASSTASLPVARAAGDLDPLVAGEDRLEGLGEQAVVVRDENADRLRLRHRLARRHLSILAVTRRIVEEDVREKIRKLLVTGDNRLKQGVDPAKARESWEQALALAREAGLEEQIRPLVELRLADLDAEPPG